MTKNSLLYVSAIVVIAKLIAFIRELVLSYYFGMTEVTDAFNIAYTIPITIIGFVATAINTSYIPVFNKADSEKGRNAANMFSNAVLYVIFLISAGTFIIIQLFAPQIVSLFASGFNSETSEMAVSLTRYMCVSVFLITYNNLISAFVQLKNRYYVVIYGNIIFYVFSIIGIVIASVWSIKWMALGVVIGYFLESLLLTIYAIKEKYKFIRLKGLNSPYFRDFVILVLPVLFGIFASDINMIVGKTLASRFQAGSVSALSYAQKINEAILSIFITSVVQLAYPRISKAVYENNNNKVSSQIENDVTFLSFVIIPVTLYILLFGKQITDLLFLRGAFTENDSQIVYYALLIYTLGLIPSAFRKYIVRIFYSFGDSKTPAFNSVIVILINILLSVILSNCIGLNGIALGASIAILLGAVRLVFKVRKYVKLRLGKFIMPIIKITTLSTCAIVISRTTYSFIEVVFNRNVSTVISGCIFMLSYLILIKAFHLGHLISYIKK